jgi:hypothetical protein
MYPANTDGALFGFENTCSLYGEAKLPITMHLDNYYRTGHWGISGGGAWNVIANGFRTAQCILHQRPEAVPAMRSDMHAA